MESIFFFLWFLNAAILVFSFDILPQKCNYLVEYTFKECIYLFHKNALYNV